MFKFLYDSSLESTWVKEARRLAERLREKGVPIEIIDTAQWSDERKWSFYLNELLPISVRFHKRLRGVLRTHKAGVIHYDSVLVTEDNFFAHEEAYEKLKELTREVEGA